MNDLPPLFKGLLECLKCHEAKIEASVRDIFIRKCEMAHTTAYRIPDEMILLGIITVEKVGRKKVVKITKKGIKVGELLRKTITELDNKGDLNE